jgi:hypothetical protein
MADTATAAAAAAKSSGGSAAPIGLVHEVGHAAQRGAECTGSGERRVQLAMRRPPPRLALHLEVRWGDDEIK